MFLEKLRAFYGKYFHCIGTRRKVNSLTSQLDSNGITVVSYPRVTGDGYYESVILDPDGNRVELVSTKNVVIAEATPADLEEILYLQKCCYLSEAELYNDYTIKSDTKSLKQRRFAILNSFIYQKRYNYSVIHSYS